MVFTVFGPCGVVTATSAHDSFYDTNDDGVAVAKDMVDVSGLPHIYTFWDSYALVFNQMNDFTYESNIIEVLEQLEARWDDVPSITTFMPYLKKAIMDNHLQMAGFVSGYDFDGNKYIQHVYRVLGEDIFRVNQDDDGHTFYSYLYVEKKHILSRLINNAQVLNGETWEECDNIIIRNSCYSIDKAIDTCKFMVKTYDYIDRINSTMYSNPLSMDVAIHTPKTLEIKKLTI